jgi:hypothetical protein
MKVIINILILFFIFIESSLCQEWVSYPYVTEKKIIELGWDLPPAKYVRDNITEMEKRPFDGVIFSSGSKIPYIFKPVDFSVDTDYIDTLALKAIHWKKFNDNFLIVWSGDDYGMSYFNDSQWDTIINNMKLLARAAKNYNCKGIDFDQEFYSKRSPWAFKDHSEGHTLNEVKSKVRQRGREVMEAWQSEYPDIIILCQYMFAYVPDRWELLPDFMNGVLEAALPSVRIIEGDEESYYWGTTNKWFDRYHELKIETKNLYCDPILLQKYDKQVQVGKSLYDSEIIRDKNTSFDKSRRLEHNVYYGLMTTDEYVWGYFERINWWGNTTPDLLPMGNKVSAPVPKWIENGIVNARKKYEEKRALGWDMKGAVWSDGSIDTTISINILSPKQGEEIYYGNRIEIIPEVKNLRDTAITRVDFFINVNKIGEDTKKQYSITIDSLPVGEYDLVVRAFSTSKYHGTSGIVKINVKSNKE